MYSVVDLFAGAGGLSHGFVQTEKFDIKVAFEKNFNAQKTYKENHKGTTIYSDVCNARYNEIIKDFGAIDVVIGGPPCQGFSNANRQKNHAISQNNMLVKQYVRAILELQPIAFVMENVSMLKSDVHRFYLAEGDQEIIDKYKIPTIDTTLNLLDPKYYERRLYEIILNEDIVKQCLWNEKDYLLLNSVYRHKKNINKATKTLEKHSKSMISLANKLKCLNTGEKVVDIGNISVANSILDYYDEKISGNDMLDIAEKSIMIQRMLSKVQEIFDNRIIVEKYSNDSGIEVTIKSYSVNDYLNKVLGSDENGYNIRGDVLCAADFGAPQKRMRYIIMGVKKDRCDTVELPKGTVSEEGYATVGDAIKDLAYIPPIINVSDDTGIAIDCDAKIKESLSPLAQELRNAKVLKNHIVTETRETAKKRFQAIKPGENFHSLDASMKEDTYSDVERTQNTIYLRLDYNTPSGTVVNVRKSMWIHPEHDRAVSVREAARLQTFPDDFIFMGSKDSQYQQVGNAVPPILAKAIAMKLGELLDN